MKTSSNRFFFLILAIFMCQATYQTIYTTPASYTFLNGAATIDQNARMYMEDRYIFNSTAHIWGVFDGHGGQSTAQYIVDAAECNGVPRIEALIRQQKHLRSSISDAEILKNSLKIIEQDLWNIDAQENTYGYGTLCNLGGMGSGWEERNEQFFAEKYNQTGATAIIAKLTDNILTIANVGDSRAVLIRDGKIIESTTDHKPYLMPEMERIQQAGGFVHGKRVWSNSVGLAVSRTIGDIDTKKAAGQTENSSHPIISAEPDLYTWRVQQSDILLIATDGLWDVMDKHMNGDNGTLQDLITKNRRYLTGTPKQLTSFLTEQAKDLGSRDNITTLAVKL